eukprot:TRINITY_DN10604_c0_g1_i1.p3 TRINITY_DN10604_c0_g1~~TRINITY_DN10604_c0_g1_i1.p3  ORF type:complete len:112 (-),score=58.61 TRINITY_DN10604_c0_g1_i1:575-910(-)
MFKRKKSNSALVAQPKFTKNLSLQTEQLRISLDIQRETTGELREEMAKLNRTLDTAVMERQDGEEDVGQIRTQVELLMRKVQSLEGQYADEQRKTAKAAKAGQRVDPSPAE